MIYGDGNYHHATYSPVYQYESPTNLASWELNIGAGKMVSDHFMVGLQAGIGSSDVEELIIGPQTTNYVGVTGKTWQAGAFCRYTSLMSKRFYTYTQLFAGGYGANYQTDNTSFFHAPSYVPETPEFPNGSGFIINLFPAVGMNIKDGYGIHADIGGISYH